MIRQITSDSDIVAETSMAFLRELLKDVRPRAFTVRLWNGTVLPATDGESSRFTLVIRHPGALRRMFSNPSELALGEAYIYDDCDIEGDIESAVLLGNALSGRAHSFRDGLRLGALLRRLPDAERSRMRKPPNLRGAVHSQERDGNAVRFHYDVSNEFYKLFLDSRMAYSSAYFEDADEDLDSAQLCKLERICRALRLHAGERFLDIGCGWGGLIIHAARTYGVQALGITLSERQAELAHERITKAGLEDRCHVELCDYRKLEEAGSFDKIASIGMVEHVGKKHLQEYFKRAWQLLRSGGLFLNGGITRPMSEEKPPAHSFVDTYVFPDSELEPVHEILRTAEEAGFEIRSIENLREHYGLTLRLWVRRLESNAAKARKITDDFTYRVWRLYTAGSAARFMSGKLCVFHALLAKQANRYFRVCR